ncbi:MAG: DUF523 domain-containing protein [Candidatus Omnitrophica bacterium]|nr:DUF523 domain-containing protein [Candidatus Omnitrophota bacterium]
MDSRPSKICLVSACLAGINCTYRGKNNLNDKIKKDVDGGRSIALCPETLASLGVPREKIELSGGDGNDVLDGKAKAISSNGTDVTKDVIMGAYKVLETAKRLGIKNAVLKSKSPTCGVGRIYDGTFSGTLRDGDGVLTALLKRSGVTVSTEKEV